MYPFLWFLILALEFTSSIGTPAQDNISALLYSTFDKKKEGKTELGLADAVIIILLAVIVNLLLLLLTHYFINKLRIPFTLKVVFKNAQIFYMILKTLWNFGSGWAEIRLAMISSPKLKNELNLCSKLSNSDVKELIQNFDRYQANIKDQGNQSVASWIKLKLIIHQQRFSQQIFKCDFFTENELAPMIKQYLNNLHIKKLDTKKGKPLAQTAVDQLYRTRVHQMISQVDECMKNKL